MTTERFADKVRAYVAYYKSGQYEQRYHARGFRVLTVIDGIGDRRTQNLLGTSAKIARIGKRFWFSHLDRLNPQSVLSQAIWHVAGEDKPQILV